MDLHIQEASSLFSLCMKTVMMALLNHGLDELHDIFDLPSVLFDELMMNLSALQLQSLHELSVSECDQKGFTTNDKKIRKKHGRQIDFNSAWKRLFEIRWPDYHKEFRRIFPRWCNDGSFDSVTDLYGAEETLLEDSNDWQQLYWERHLQSCLDEATEKVLVPTFAGHVRELKISDSIMKSVGYCENQSNDFSKLLYHCHKFGCYARCLRLHNILCTADTYEFFQTFKLKKLTFRRIIFTKNVNGACLILNQNKEYLKTLEFIDCRLPLSSLSQILSSISFEGTENHGIEHLSIKSSTFADSKSSQITCFLSFIFSGRSLLSLKLCDAKMDPRSTELIFDTLLKSSCCLTTLEISDDDISGSLTKVHGRFVDRAVVLGRAVSLSSLSILILRGCNLHKEDAEALYRILLHLTNLRVLDISDNPIEDDGVRSLIPYFNKACGRNNSLSVIKLENCNISGASAIELLDGLLMIKEPINIFSIARNDLGGSVAASLHKFIDRCEVKILDIEDIGLGSSGFEELEKKIPDGIAIVCINISKNRGGSKTVEFISKILLRAPDLISINSGYNFIPPESSTIIYNALNHSKAKLQRLDLSGNSNLYDSSCASKFMEFQFHGKPVVIFSPFTTQSMPYDDDP